MRQVLGLQNARGGAGVYLIEKSFSFSAAHCLRQQADAHKCTNLHGHNYTVTVAVQGDQLSGGMVIDCALIAKAVEPLVSLLDHTNLNDHFEWETTSENLAQWFYTRLKLIGIQPAWVEVTETPTITARYWE